jgi:hypothetical protein
MTELAEIRSMFEVVMRKLKDLEPKRAPLTRAAFAKATGYSYKTICRKVESGNITEKDGRIPASELDRYLS